MRVRITFRSEIIIEGKDLDDCVEQWDTMGYLFSEEAQSYNADYVELVSADNYDTGEELESYFD